MRAPELFRPLEPMAQPQPQHEPATTQLITATVAPATAKLALGPSNGLLNRVQTRRPSNHPVAAVRPSELLALGSQHAVRNTAAGRRGKPNRGGSLQKLLVATIVMATIGTLASGTLATFTAQTSNANNSFATGTLVLGNAPTGRVPLSATVANGGSLSTINVQRLSAAIAAGTVVTISDNVTPVAGTQTVTVAVGVLAGATAITTSGGPVAARIYPQTTATVNFPLSYASVRTTVAIANAAAITTVTVAAVQNLVPSGTIITISNGLQSQNLTTTVSANVGDTTFTTTSVAAIAAYPIGSTVSWSAAGVASATTASVTGTVTAIPVNALTAPIPANAVILLNNPALGAPNLQTLSVTAAGAPLGATSIPVTSTLLNNTYPGGSVITYNYSSGSLCYSTATSGGTFNNANANAGCNSLNFTGYGRPQSNTENAYAADLTITNQGSITATKLSVYMANCATTNNLAETYNGTGDLCTKLEMFVQEWQDAAHTVALTCWYGSGSASTCTNPMPDPSPTLSAFNNSAAPLTLTGGLNPKASAGDTRYFTVGLRLPTTTDNTYQGRVATFDLVWTLTQ